MENMKDETLSEIYSYIILYYNLLSAAVQYYLARTPTVVLPFHTFEID